MSDLVGTQIVCFVTHRLNWNLITKRAPDILVLQCIETINLETMMIGCCIDFV